MLLAACDAEGGAGTEPERAIVGGGIPDHGMPAPVTVVIEMLGHPRGKGSPRRDRMPNGAHITHKDEKTAEFEGNLKVHAKLAMGGRPPLRGYLKVVIDAHFPLLESWSKKQRDAALQGRLRPGKKPDWDNIGKVCDGCNKVVWVDDAQIVDGRVIKFYSERPLLRIKVWALQ